MGPTTGGVRAVEVSVLGPLVLRVDGDAVDVPGGKRRAVLALLAMAAPDALTADRLVDAIWPEDPPSSGRAAVQSHVSRLRRHLGPHADRLTTTEGGYRLALAHDELDATRVAGLVAEARRRATTEPDVAGALLVEAAGAWRAEPLADLLEVEPLAAWSRALVELRLEACELLAECALRWGTREGTIVAAHAAGDALAREPLRESSALLLARSLAAQGRAAEALRALHDHRRRLVDEAGLDPSPALAELEGEIATGAPSVAVDRADRAASDEPRTPGPGDAASSIASAPPPDRGGPLLGRDAEVAGLVRLLATERLVTIVGPGGVGKTRVAMEVARRAAATTDVAVLELAPVTDPDVLPDALARALGLGSFHGDPLDRCTFHLAGGASLLVVDNCEHLLDPACRLVSTLLSRCPELTVVATSRTRLGVPVEQTSPLAPLPLPADDEAGLELVPSVALFLDRARRVRPQLRLDPPQLAAVARVVRALDGMPLAIELAAGRMASLGIEDLEARVDRALDLLGRPAGGVWGQEERHRTLRAAVAWSYDLLADDEQRLFRNLSVFPGGVDLATAELVGRDLALTVDPAEALADLVDRSMVVAELDGSPRYRMLDTLRHYGLDRLRASGEEDAATERLLRWAVDLATELQAANETEAELDADRRLRAELANLRTAWRTARDRGDLDVAAAIVVGLYSLVSLRDLTEPWRWFLELADDPALMGHPREAQVLGVAAEAAWSSTGDLPLAEALARRAVAAVEPGDDLGFALATWALADVLLFLGDYDRAADLAIEARAGTRWLAEGYGQAAIAKAYAGDVETARRHLARAVEEVGGPSMRSYLRYVAGEIANVAGDWDEARSAYRDAIVAARDAGTLFVEGIALVGLASVQAADGEVAEALDGYDELITRWERTGAWTQQWTTLRNLADLLERLGDTTAAAELRQGADDAPEAASLGGRARTPGRHGGGRGRSRDQVLRLAREAIARARPAARS